MIGPGLCACGCGLPTRIAKKTNTRVGDIKGQARRFLVGHSARGRCGPRNSKWRGGRSVTRWGYVMIYAPDRPQPNGDPYAFEHVLVAEKALGHRLPLRAEVHHVDLNKQNNAPTNLVVCEDDAYHKLLHQRLRALEACGDPSARRCSICSGYDRQDAMYVHPRGKFSRHRDCESKRRYGVSIVRGGNR